MPVPLKSRKELNTEIIHWEKKFQKGPENAENRFQYARMLYQSGDFWQARDLLVPLILQGLNSVNLLFLMADLEYLTGNYLRAENILSHLIVDNPKDTQVQAQARLQLILVYYQTGQFSKADQLFEGQDVNHPLLKLLLSFGEEKPNQQIWATDQPASLDFLVTDPLPILQIEVEDTPLYVLLDTGGDSLILDTEFASTLGLDPVSTSMGKFAGGLEAEVALARVNKLKLNQVSLHNVPVTILPTRRFSKGFAEGKYQLDGILGTGILKQFLSTVDYGNEKLILHTRDEDRKEAFEKSLKGKQASKVPFVLNQTHMMMAKGSLNDSEGLTFFVDSGLDSEAAMTAPAQTLKDAGIPEPEVKIDENSIGGGGGNYASGLFDIQKLGLGSLIQENIKGEYGSITPESYWENGFIQDGIISHGFLREYAWTIDFDNMEMIFVPNVG